jgi:hypothetical protein
MTQKHTLQETTLTTWISASYLLFSQKKETPKKRGEKKPKVGLDGFISQSGGFDGANDVTTSCSVDRNVHLVLQFGTRILNESNIQSQCLLERQTRIKRCSKIRTSGKDGIQVSNTVSTKMRRRPNEKSANLSFLTSAAWDSTTTRARDTNADNNEDSPKKSPATNVATLVMPTKTLSLS